MSSSLVADPASLPFGRSRAPLSASRIALIAWVLCCGAMLAVFAHNIVHFTFMDTDDAMRLSQVRDLVAGQSWFDVTQYRVNPPTGGPMHWSRLVDAPIAAIILIARPLLGQTQAEIVACAVTPLLLLGLLAAALFHAARRIGGDAVAALAVGVLCTTPTILIQFMPIRIDHHGWQAVMATIALCGALDVKRMRGGAVAGAAMAVWLQISTEGLPYAAMFGGLFTIRYWIDPREGDRLRGFCAIGVAAPLLLLATKGPSALAQTACDALSAVYIWPLALFGGVVTAGMAIGDRRTLRNRIAAPMLGGAVAAAALAWLGLDCLTKGPFHALTPLAYEQWYMRVMEGRPLWEQEPSLAAVSLLPALVALIATTLAWRSAVDDDARVRWTVSGALLLGATLMATFVMRAMTVSHVFSLPAIAWLLIHLFRKAQALSTAPARILSSVALMMLTPVGLSSTAATALAPIEGPAPQKTDCRTPEAIAGLNALPPSLLFTPLDLGPDILAHTRHSVIGTGHHRNVIGINAVTHAFLATPDAASKDVMAARAGTGADYVVLCARMNEVQMYEKDAPQGLAAQLVARRTPRWLTPVRVKGPLLVYRVRRE